MPSIFINGITLFWDSIIPSPMEKMIKSPMHYFLEVNTALTRG